MKVFYNWCSGSQECIFVLQWCLKPCIPPNSFFLWSAVWHLLSISLSVWAGWVWAFLLWYGSVYNIVHTSGSVTSSSGAGQTANPALLAISLFPGFPLPSLLLSQWCRLKSSLERGWSSVHLYSAVWMETRGWSVPLGTSLNINDV